MLVLVVNAGSSSLKLRVIDDTDHVVASSDLPRLAPPGLAEAFGSFLGGAPEIEAVGHRVVHGGPTFTAPVLIDEAVKEALDALVDLAPLHNAESFAAIDAMRAARPGLPQVACFDTSFHAGMPAKASTYALPRSWREDWGLRRYGFHGLSHCWASRRASELLGRPREELRLVTAHIGGGASLAAVAGGRSVDTTMGFTPMEGLVMATRSGSVDPGLLLWAQRHGGLTTAEVEEALENHSGLLGLSGKSADLRAVITAADAGDAEALLAYEVYVYKIQVGVAAMCAALGGLDALVFTGGAGEASARLRLDTCAGLGFLGLALDPVRNRENAADGSVGPGAAVDVLVVRAREDLEIARHVRDLLD